MRAALVAAGLLLAGAVAPALAQAPAREAGPDLGPVGQAADQAAGTVVPPVLNASYRLLGQNLSREDVRIQVDLNVTKGDVNILGLLVGSGRAEVQAKLHARLEMRVLSANRIRALLESQNAYNLSAGNATALSEAYIPADVFRATLTAEAAAAFQRAEEDAIVQFLREAVPEMDILSLRVTWSNVSPLLVVNDTDLKEPPIVVELDLVAQYIRVESIQNLVHAYAEGKHTKDTGKDAYVKRLKADNGDPLRSRDFFAAAAYTQLLNLSMQPGWSLDVNLSVPPGYSFTYANQNVRRPDARHLSFHVGGEGTASRQASAPNPDLPYQDVFLAAITQKRAVALALFGAMWAVGLVAGFPLRFLYVRRRVR